MSIPKNSQVSLSQTTIPSSQWPQVRMLDLPVPQDACKNTTFKLAYTGTAAKK